MNFEFKNVTQMQQLAINLGTLTLVGGYHGNDLCGRPCCSLAGDYHVKIVFAVHCILGIKK